MKKLVDECKIILRTLKIMGNKEKNGVSAGELIDRLKEDPIYTSRMTTKEKHLNALRKKHKAAELPILQDLSKVGFVVNSLDTLRTSGTKYKDAVPILLKWLKETKDEDMKESIVRTLTVPWAPPDVAKAMLFEFQRAENAQLKWAIGNALEVVADESILDDLIKIVLDPKNGTSRQMVILAIGKRKAKERAIEAVLPLLEDEGVVGHAIAALGRLKANIAREQVERLLNHPKAWIRKEAKHALKKMR